MNFYGEHNLIPRIPEMPTNVDTIMVNNYLHFDQISATLNIDKEHLKALNPMYRRGVIPATDKKPYPLVLPYQKAFEFIEKDTSVFAYERNKYFPNNTLINPAEKSSGYFNPADIAGKSKIIYTVKSCDTVGGISKKYRVRSADLAYWNNIRKNRIRAGQKLAIYVPEKDKAKKEKTPVKNDNGAQPASSTAAVSKQDSTTTNIEYEMYIVKKGDNVASIAQKFDGVTGSDIIQLNNIKNVRGLAVGQKLKIPKKS
jgi:membrane-bound lytic murein transglycosylase D